MKNRSHRYDINRHRSRYGHRYTKYKMWFSIMVALCIKQHLSLTTSRMGQFNWAWDQHGFRNVWTHDGKILFKVIDSYCTKLFCLYARLYSSKVPPGSRKAVIYYFSERYIIREWENRRYLEWYSIHQLLFLQFFPFFKMLQRINLYGWVICNIRNPENLFLKHQLDSHII